MFKVGDKVTTAENSDRAGIITKLNCDNTGVIRVEYGRDLVGYYREAELRPVTSLVSQEILDLRARVERLEKQIFEPKKVPTDVVHEFTVMVPADWSIPHENIRKVIENRLTTTNNYLEPDEYFDSELVDVSKIKVI